ncbi:RpiR family transcriptional regulator [Aestuariivirga litoralis]|uniref:RpiR family transcriptional regulator n=1 Tax=Aestuariivirga litoralis TaxID=2650924 RepID=A0A2W2CAB8_9HYPH|nr:MurR/RpiR family transcriptional regulator [Aestuariivirga litoralis]PZF77113.1 RpiR family transcriptional regulator [Aestuariivirga litoralis]
MTETLSPPRDFAALKLQLAALAGTLPKRLLQIAGFAIDHPDEIAFGTVSSIAEQAGVQPSALVRFAQALGYQGFSDMQEVFRSRLRERIPNYDERLQQLRQHAPDTSQPNVILHGFCEASARSLAGLQEKLDPAALDGAVEDLARAETIYLVGLRRSFPIASYMAYALGKLGVRATLVDAVGGLAAEQITFATRRDAVLAISFTPYAPETLSLARAAAEKGVPVIALTDSPFSPLAQIGGRWIEISEANFEGFRSMAATLALAMTLTVAIAGRRAPPG